MPRPTQPAGSGESADALVRAARRAGQAHRLPPGRPPAALSGGRRPDPGRHARSARSGVALCGRPRRQLRDLRRHPHPRRDDRCAAQAGLGATLGAPQGRGKRLQPCARSKSSPAAKRATRRSPRAWALSIDEYHRVMQDASSCQIASLDEVIHGIGCGGPDGRPVARGAERRVPRGTGRRQSPGCRSANGWSCRCTTTTN